MFKRLLIAVSFVAAALSFQTPAQANGKVAGEFGSGHGLHKGKAVHKKFHKPQRRFHRQRQGFHQPVHKARVHKKFVKKKQVHKPIIHKKFVKKKFIHKTPKHIHKVKRHRLTNQQLRHHLKAKGLFNIRFVDRHQGVAKVIAHNQRGYIAKYRVSTRNGHILSGRVLRNARRIH